MKTAVLCPVCVGKGKVIDDEKSGNATVKCHGCVGRGWVEVGTDYPSPLTRKQLVRGFERGDFRIISPGIQQKPGGSNP